MPFMGGGGGSGGGGSVLGPYNFLHGPLDAGYVKMADFANGTIIWRILSIVRQAFTAADETIQFYLSPTGSPGGNGFIHEHAALAVAGDASSGPWLASDALAIEAQAVVTVSGGTHGPPMPRVGLAQHSASLYVTDKLGGNTAGSIDVYLLAS